MAAELPRQPAVVRGSRPLERSGRVAARPADLPRLRVLWLLLMAAVLAVAIFGHLVYWQVDQHRHLSQVAVQQYSKRVTLPATRGSILDSQGRPLAVDTAAYSVFVSPTQIAAGDRDAVVGALSRTLNMPSAPLAATLASGQQFAYVRRRVPQATADALRSLSLPGVGLQREAQRAYLPGGAPGESLAANVLGFVNYAGTGQYGLEGFYNSVLGGRDGSVSTYQDLANRTIVLGAETRRDPVNGRNLSLTIDSQVQYAAEQALAQGVQANHAESGSVLIMDPHSGGIVAWADYPSYDANQFAATDVARFSDPAVSDLYEPGSVMKVATLAGAIDSGAITPSTMIDDPGYVRVGGFAIHDWDLVAHGRVSMTNVLEHSLNVGAIKAMQAEGAAAYYRYLRAFGFGAPTGIDVTGEPDPALALRPLAQWQDSEMATASFGQGIDVNMVQMLAAVNVIANGGRYAAPHLLQRGSGPTVTPQRQVVSSHTAAEVTAMMQSVVQHGSGHEAKVLGFELDEAGKTGTSQIPEQGQYSSQVWASYVGFMPALNPRFTMLVVIRKPNNPAGGIANDGYIVAAPIWRQIAQSMVLQWRITPDAGLVAQP